MIKFLGQTLKCGTHHSTIQFIPGELLVERTAFWGLEGESEIVSKPKHGIIEATVWLNDNWLNAAGMIAMNRYVQNDIFKLRGRNGTVQETGVVPQLYEYCTLISFTTIPLTGQERPSPTQLIDSGEYFTAGIFRWAALCGK